MNNNDYYRIYRLKNKERLKQYYRDYRNKNREKYREYYKNFIDNNPDYFKTAHYREIKHKYYLNNLKSKQLGDLKVHIIHTTKDKNKVNNLIKSYANYIKNYHNNVNNIDDERKDYLKHYYYSEDYNTVLNDNWEE
jgi:hypothetical protein